MTTKPKVTSVQDYRQKQSEPTEIILPSGAVFRVRRLTPLDYIKEGLADIPNEFLQFIAEMQMGKHQVKDTEGEKKNFELFERFMTVTLDKGVVEPLITLRYDPAKVDTHLIYLELSNDDQKALVDAIMGKK